MIIVLIHWRIKPTKKDIDEFLEFWRKTAIVEDRSGMVGEFLSTLESPQKLPYITWNLDDKPESYTSFINVGFWQDEEAFSEQIARYFDDTKPIKSFEEVRRVRTVLRPKCWRIGDRALPHHDSGGVL